MKTIKIILLAGLFLGLLNCISKRQVQEEELNMGAVSSNMILQELQKREKISFIKYDTLTSNLEHVMIEDSIIGRSPASFFDFSKFTDEELLSFLEKYKRSDNRKDYYMVNKVEVRNNFDGVAVVMFDNQIRDNGLFKSRQLSEKIFEIGDKYFNGCSTNKFKNQFELAKCTAFAISKWHLVTAGHEINPKNFKNYVFVFEMQIEEQGKFPEKIKSENIYKPVRIEEYKYQKETGLDYAIIRVNKPIPENRILKYDNLFGYQSMQRLYTIGASEGLPLKYTPDGFMDYAVNENLISTDINAFEGNSGSPVFNINDKVVGMIIAGQVRYFLDNENMCVSPNSCLQYECAEEHILKLGSIPLEKYLK